MAAQYYLGGLGKVVECCLGNRLQSIPKGLRVCGVGDDKSQGQPLLQCSFIRYFVDFGLALNSSRNPGLFMTQLRPSLLRQPSTKNSSASTQRSTERDRLNKVIADTDVSRSRSARGEDIPLGRITVLTDIRVESRRAKEETGGA
jgi:hypothetical protein